MLKVVLAVLVFLALMRLGVAILRAFGRPVPAPLPPGELRKVNLRYQCVVCGTTVRMVSAADEEPEAPRHCREDMEQVAPLFE
jgi:hypothetical protein